MKKLWIAFIAVVIISFAVLGWAGYKIYHEKPPIPGEVVTSDGQIIIPSGADQHRSKCLAGDGWDGAWFDLGTW